MQFVLCKLTVLPTITSTAMAAATTTASFLFNHHHHHHHHPHSHSISFPSLNPNPDPHRISFFLKPFIPRHYSSSMKIAPLSSMSEQPPTDIDNQTLEEQENIIEEDPPNSEKPSFAVATGELFIGIASRFIRGRKNLGTRDDSLPVVLDSGERIVNGERIATVVEDSLQPEVLWEQREKDVEAEKLRKMVTNPGFSFSAAGLLFPYHLGVSQFLIEKGYIKETTPLAGSSAGAIVCAVIASGAGMKEALQATKILAKDCRLNGTAFRLGAILRDILDKVLPDDIHSRCNGRVRVAVTQIVWRPRGLLVDQFDSKEDLINALITSSFIPGYLAPRPVTVFRNRLCIDGGLTLFMPPTSAPQTVRVCAFPAGSLGYKGIGISPDCNPKDKLTNRQLFNWAREPADDVMLDKLFELGYSDAAVWAADNPVDLIQNVEAPIL